MSLINKYKDHIALHTTVLVWGFTGILGKLISIPSTHIVFYRMGIAMLSLFLYLQWKKKLYLPSPKKIATFLGVGVIIALHWITFFEALHVSNVSVTLTCLATATFFTAIFEPIVFRKKPVVYELLLGVLVIAGLYIIFEFESKYTYGIILSLFSAAMAALFNVINGKLIKKNEASIISSYEMFGGFAIVSLYLLFFSEVPIGAVMPNMNEWFYLVLLGTICTAIAFLIAVQVLKNLSPYTVSISINMEPIYSIILALLFFGESERMTPAFYFGALIILATIFINAILKRREKRLIAKKSAA